MAATNRHRPHRNRFLIPAGFLGVIALAAALIVSQARPALRRSFPSIGYGVQAFLWWNDALRQRDLEFVRMMRFQYVKQIFAWKDIQPVQDLPEVWIYADEVVAEVEYRGLKLIARLGEPPSWALRVGALEPDEPPFDEAAFGRFCGKLAARYKGKIAGYQVWNEPNLDREWGERVPNAAGYVKLLAPCYRAIKDADPAAIVITAGLAPTGTHSPEVMPDEMYLREMFRAGVRDYYDVLGLNAPGYKSPPETDPATLGEFRWQAFRHVEDMRAVMVEHGEGHKQVAILEMGWTTDPRDTITGADGASIPNPYRWHAITEKQQAEFLIGAYEYAAQHWRPWISLMITIYIPDPEWTPENEEFWWALAETRPTYRLREAYIALANSARYVDDTYTPTIDPGLNPYKPLPPRKP